MDENIKYLKEKNNTNIIITAGRECGSVNQYIFTDYGMLINQEFLGFNIK